MFDQAFETLRKTTDATIAMQQDLFRKWVNFWPGGSLAQPAWTEQVQKAYKQWTEFVAELVKKQRELFQTQFAAGLKSIEESYQMAEVKSPEALREKTVELWKKSFDCLRQAYEAQTSALQSAIGKWTELVTRGA
jgi:hypothetical protein